MSAYSERINIVPHNNICNIVIAVPGGGKTTYICSDIVKKLEDTLPSEFLVISFQKKSVDDINSRIEKMNGPSSIARTLHSWGNAILHEYPEKFGLESTPTLLELKKDDRLFNLYREISKKNREKCLERKKVENIYRLHTDTNANANAKVMKWLESNGVNQSQWDVLKRTIRKFKKLKKRSGLIEFEDQYLLPLQVMKKDPAFLKTIANRYRYLYVDEVQDLTRKQLELLLLLQKYIPETVFVGDVNQSIYEFRGAENNAFSFIEKNIANANVVYLEKSYRLTKPIAKLINNLYTDCAEPYKIESDKHGPRPLLLTVDTTYDMYDQAIRKIHFLKKKGRKVQTEKKINRIAVVARTNAEIDLFKKYMDTHNIRYFFTEDNEKYLYIKKLLVDFIKVATNPEKDSMADLLQRLCNLNEDTANASACHYMQRLPRAIFDNGIIKTRVKKCLKAIEDASKQSNPISIVRIFQSIHGIIDEEFDGIMLDSLTRNILYHAAEYTSVQELIGSIDSLKDNDDLTDVVFSTIHAAKGLEYDGVIILGVNDGSIPIRWNLGTDIMIHQELNMFNVAISRSAYALVLIEQKSTETRDKHQVTNKRTRFIKQLSRLEDYFVLESVEV